MNLFGYLQPLKFNSFAIPVYIDDLGNSYFHQLNDFFEIDGFEKIKVNTDDLIPVYFTKKFLLNSIGAIVFIGEGNVFYNYADEIIDDIYFYLETTTKKELFNNIKKEVLELKQVLQLRNVELVKKDQIQKELNEYDPRRLDVQDAEYVFFPPNIINDDSGIVIYSFEEYLEQEVKMLESRKQTKSEKSLTEIDIICELILGNNKLSTVNKEILRHICDYTLKNQNNCVASDVISIAMSDLYKCSFEKINALQMTIEDMLYFRSEERKLKMKNFNYQFQNKHDLIIEQMTNQILNDKEIENKSEKVNDPKHTNHTR